MKYLCARGSRQGGRSSNQDRVAIATRENAVLMVLGDGLGGHKGGEIAAETLCRVALQAFQAIRTPVINDPSSFLAFTAFHAHDTLRQLGQRFTPPIEPRTTCVLCLVQLGRAYWAHIGDSRLYHFHHGRLAGRTRDDTTIDTFRERGILDETEGRYHPDKSRLLACLGAAADPVLNLGAETLLGLGDTLLLCSDGVWETLGTAEIVRFLAQPVLDNGLTDLLLAAETRHPGRADNISAVALRWQEPMAAASGRALRARTITARQLWAEGQRLAVTRKLQRPE